MGRKSKGDFPVGKYIQFSEDDIKRARETDIASLLRSEGQALKKAGSEMVWGDGSEKVTVRGNLWYHQYDAEGGDAIRFVERFYHRSFPEAVEFLLGNQFGALQIPSPVPKTTKAFRPPEKNENMRRVYAYLLNQRGIEKEVLDQFVRCGLIYEDAVYHNCVFVGMDENGTVKHCHKRSIGSRSTFKVNAPGSDPAYSFHWLGGSENLFLFEAPIDMLSFISMHGEEWKQENYAACCGVSDRVLFHILDKHSEI